MASACRNCGAPIDWRETSNGRLQPIDPDTGEVHFATCAARPAKPALPSHVCLKCGSLDLEHLPGVAMHHGAIRCRDCGAHRWLPKPR
jgi:DNA-directed RNA polymerase subunit RPC12/RpoP